jgi:hypothetical protein
VTPLPQADVDPADSRDVSIGVPGDKGWVTWNTGRCSITRCLDGPVAAIERACGLGRLAHWQPYCAAHAHERGVEAVDGTLVWTAEFLSPSRRGRASRGSGPRRPDDVPVHPAVGRAPSDGGTTT